MKAYTQGNVDFFCSVYAIINACRLAMKDYKHLDFFEGCAFYQYMMQGLIDKGLLEEVLYKGSDYEIMMMLLARARGYLHDKYGLQLIYKRPFIDTKIPVERALKIISQYLGRNDNAACIMRFFNPGVLDHWSVIRRAYGLTLKLMDSYNYPEMDIKKCKWAPYHKDGRNYLAKEGVIFIKVAKFAEIAASLRSSQ